MQPVYVKKTDPRDRSTWMDEFISLEPVAGVRAVVDGIQYGSRSKDLTVFVSLLTAPVRHRPATFGPKRQRVRS